jgi:uncharacterized protein (DUF433 family)
MIGREPTAFVIYYLRRRRAMHQTNLPSVLDRNEDKVSGSLVFRGTRVPVAALFENLKDGASVDEFLEWFPGVTRSQVETLLDFELAAPTTSS